MSGLQNNNTAYNLIYSLTFWLYNVIMGMFYLLSLILALFFYLDYRERKQPVKRKRKQYKQKSQIRRELEESFIFLFAACWYIIVATVKYVWKWYKNPRKFSYLIRSYYFLHGVYTSRTEFKIRRIDLG